VLLPRQQAKLARGAKDKEHAMSQTPNTAIAVIGIDIGKNSFHVVGHDARGAIVLRQKWSRGQVEAGCVKTRRLWLGSRQQLARAGLCHARIASINPPTPRMRITRFML
jgi:hypothetical protein